MSDQNFQVNLSGVIRLLSDHLYSGPEVFARELLQNAVDAITARQHGDPDYRGQIRIEVLEHHEGAKTISVEDNGIGLTESEVHQFLATIGESSKSNNINRQDFIGQFGIGLLSGFVVSDEITVITQSIQDDCPPVEWKGRVDGTYSVRVLDSKLSPGTRVYLQAKPEQEELFGEERVEQLLRHYGHHLEHPIEFVRGSESVLLNEVPPWRQPFASQNAKRQALLEYGQEMFGTQFLDAISLHSATGDVEGVAYVLPFAASPAARQNHRVYLKNMLLSESVEGLLPDWAFFIKCVVNANDLRPNASRDSFYEDEKLEIARNQLGACLRDYLVNLAQTDRNRLDAIIHLHYLPIKSLAVEDDEFFRLFIDWLPFETTVGQITLEEHFQGSNKIRYLPGVDQFRQISSVANAKGICVFNAGYTYDAALLEKVGHEFSDRRVEKLDVEDFVQDFEDLTLDENEQAFEFTKLADLVLQKYKCGAEVRKFAPVDMPTLYTANETASFLRNVDQTKEDADELWSGVLDNVAKAAGGDAYAQLVFNFNNPLVQRIVSIEDRELCKRLIEILYLQALLLGHYPLRSGELSILGSGILGLINHFLDPEST